MGSIAIDTTQLNMSVTDPTAWATAMNNLGMVPVGLAGQQLVTGKTFLLKEFCFTSPWILCNLLEISGMISEDIFIFYVLKTPPIINITYCIVVSSCTRCIIYIIF